MAMREPLRREVIEALLKEHGEREVERIGLGVKQVADRWRDRDGDEASFRSFCLDHYRPEALLDRLTERFARKEEALAEAFGSLGLALRLESHEATGPLEPVDALWAAFSPGAHLGEDLFASKIAFVALLNYPRIDLSRKLAEGDGWSSRDWCRARLADGYGDRVPADVQSAIGLAFAEADHYGSTYDIPMDRLRHEGRALFPEGKLLLAHWGLRDEIRALYGEGEAGVTRQRCCLRVLEQIVEQRIPRAFPSSTAGCWDPFEGTTEDLPPDREPDLRYEQLLACFCALRRSDPHHPEEPSHVQRSFERSMEIPELEVESLLVEILQAPVGRKVAELISTRLDRPLEPFDLWYTGFRAGGAPDERALDVECRRRWTDAEAFQRSLPALLETLGFSAERAAYLGTRIEVDAARGSGHAFPCMSPASRAHLRTRIPREGMDYKGFNIAAHELGHTVEQVFSTDLVASPLLKGVPNTAFSEAFAFLFQGRDLQLLGRALPPDDGSACLDDFWATRVFAGAGLTDLAVWRWLYEHENATAAELREATVEAARGIWQKYFAELLGGDSPVLAAYTHLIIAGLYLPNYAVGRIVARQLGAFFETHDLGEHMERMCAQGRLTPDAWMRGAVGTPLSVRPMLDGAAAALVRIRV